MQGCIGQSFSFQESTPTWRPPESGYMLLWVTPFLHPHRFIISHFADHGTDLDAPSPPHITSRQDRRSSYVQMWDIVRYDAGIDEATGGAAQ